MSARRLSQAPSCIPPEGQPNHYLLRNLCASIRKWRNLEAMALRSPRKKVAIGLYVSWPAAQCREAAREAIRHAKHARGAR